MEKVPPNVLEVLAKYFLVNTSDHHGVRVSSAKGRYEFTGHGASRFLICDRGGWRVVLHPDAFSVVESATEWAHIQYAANCTLRALMKRAE